MNLRRLIVAGSSFLFAVALTLPVRLPAACRNRRAAECPLPRGRRSAHRPRLLRQPRGEDAAPRRPRAPGRALRARLLPAGGLQPLARLASHRPPPGHGEGLGSAATLPPGAPGRRHAAAAFQGSTATRPSASASSSTTSPVRGSRPSLRGSAVVVAKPNTHAVGAHWQDWVVAGRSLRAAKAKAGGGAVPRRAGPRVLRRQDRGRGGAPRCASSAAPAGSRSSSASVSGNRTCRSTPRSGTGTCTIAPG
jgi:hypothetical protein